MKDGILKKRNIWRTCIRLSLAIGIFLLAGIAGYQTSKAAAADNLVQEETAPAVDSGTAVDAQNQDITGLLIFFGGIIIIIVVVIAAVTASVAGPIAVILKRRQ